MQHGRLKQMLKIHEKSFINNSFCICKKTDVKVYSAIFSKKINTENLNLILGLFFKYFVFKFYNH